MVGEESEKAGNSNLHGIVERNSVDLPNDQLAVKIAHTEIIPPLGPTQILSCYQGASSVGPAARKSCPSLSKSLEDFQDSNPFGPLQKPRKNKFIDFNISVPGASGAQAQNTRALADPPSINSSPHRGSSDGSSQS